jgi:hypothetical protein
MITQHTIPADVKLRLRQESSFGCCKCGNPIIEYHHIIPLEEEEHDRVEDMMCLCPTHHKEADVTRREDQRELKAKPYNKEKDYVNGMFFINQPVPVVNIGGNFISNNGPMLLIDDQDILSMTCSEENRTEISVNLFDEADNSILRINKNEWESGDYLAWDIEYRLNFIKVRHKKREIALQLDARSQPVLLIGTLWYKKQKFEIKPSSLVFSGTAKRATFAGCTINGKMTIDTARDCLLIGR